MSRPDVAPGQPPMTLALAPETPVRNSGIARGLPAVEATVAVLCLILFSEGLGKFIGADPLNPSEGSPLARASFYPAYIVALLGLLACWGRALAMSIRLPFMLGILALSALSVLWSVNPDLTYRRVIALIMTTAFGLYLAARFDWQRLSEIVAGGYLLLALASFFLAIAMPGLGVMSEVHPGAWSGLFTEKNALGGHMARGVVFTLLAMFLSPKRAWLWGGATLLLIALVLLSTSKTSLLGLVLVIGIITALFVASRAPVLATIGVWGLLAGLGLVTGVLLMAPELFFGLIGRDASLTGRTEIWEALEPLLQDRPWLGYGFAAFWNNTLGPAWIIREQLGWGVPTAHNGWIEVQLSLGLIGLVLIALMFAQTCFQAVQHALRWPVGPCLVAYLAVYALFSTSESMLLQHNNLTWVLLVMVAAKLALPDRPWPVR